MEHTVRANPRTSLVAVQQVVGISIDPVARTLIFDLQLETGDLLGVKITRDQAAALLDAIDDRLNALAAFLVGDLPNE